jgi:hypothetical protein
MTENRSDNPTSPGVCERCAALEAEVARLRAEQPAWRGMDTAPGLGVIALWLRADGHAGEGYRIAGGDYGQRNQAVCWSRGRETPLSEIVGWSPIPAPPPADPDRHNAEMVGRLAYLLQQARPLIEHLRNSRGQGQDGSRVAALLVGIDAALAETKKGGRP